MASHSMKVNGFSKYPLKAFNHLAPTAPSTVLWSELNVTFIIWAVLKPFSVSGAGTRVGTVAPIARMHDCGGLMMAVKWLIPNMPKLETVNVPPCWGSRLAGITPIGVKGHTWYSWGCSLPSLAFLAKALASAEMVVRPFDPTSVTIGVINPVGVATAIDTSAFFHLCIMLENPGTAEEMRYPLSDVLAHPRGVSLRDVGKSQSNSLNDEVVHAQLGTLIFFGERSIEDFPKLDDFAHIDVDGEVIVRPIAFGLSETGANCTPHVCQRTIGVSRSSDSRLGSGYADTLCGGFELLDVLTEDPSVRAGTLDLRERNSAFKGDLLGNGSSKDDVPGGKLSLGRGGSGFGLFLRRLPRFRWLLFSFCWFGLRLGSFGGKGVGTREVITFLADNSNGGSDRNTLGTVGRLRERMRRVLACLMEYLR
jgi:hypothetical protein